MLSESQPAKPPALLICGSLIQSPDDIHLPRLRSKLVHDAHLAELRNAVVELPELWALLVEKEPLLQKIGAGPLLQALAEWLTSSGSCALSMAGRISTNTLLAVLTVLSHIIEYTMHLDHHEEDEDEQHGEQDAHARNLGAMRDGGIQGLCVGLLSATARALDARRGPWRSRNESRR